jgi:hypothetical protein
MKKRHAALGMRARSGWATAIVVSGDVRAAEVILRERLVLSDPKLRGSVQPYHALMGLPLEKAEDGLERFRRSTGALARDAVKSLVDRAREIGFEVASGCILRSSGRPLPDLPHILASHPTVHSAEGEFFRDALRDACESAGIRVFGVKEKEAWTHVSHELGLSVNDLRHRVITMGHAVGRPWRMDEKLATLAAWLVIEGVPGTDPPLQAIT